jgi:hypothetical protein
MKLQLALKAEYFDAIKAGTKPEEYRLANDYWRNRLIIGGPKGVLARTFDGIVLTKGYPRSDNIERRIELPWRGWTLKVITHPHFGPEPVKVFAIDVREATP